MPGHKNEIHDSIPLLDRREKDRTFLSCVFEQLFCAVVESTFLLKDFYFVFILQNVPLLFLQGKSYSCTYTHLDTELLD